MEAPAAPMLCSSMGATNSLLKKMTALTENRRNPMIKELMEDINRLRDDFLDKFSGRRRADKGEQVKVWMKQARETIYDIEDWIDLRQEDASEESDEKQIKKFRHHIEEARERCERYELPSQVPAASDPELVYGGSSREAAGAGCGLLGKKTAMVGIDGAKSKLLNHLKNEQEELMVVSILGGGGHGKTALAKEICGDTHIKEQFECQAFVSVGRTTSTRITLIDILTQVNPEADAAAWQSTRSCNEVVTEIWGFLRTKRYFIFIDDMRDTNDSEFIFCALPENNLGSRILTTTRMEDIAISCSSRPNDLVHEMVPLDETYSKSLFRNSVYVDEEKWPDNFKECSKKMLGLCGGFPMAIIIAAGLFGRSCEELSVQSEMLIKTILPELDQFCCVSQSMRNILDISYGVLPLPLKSCLLYMAAFPGNSEIKKDRLIRRWIAEGIVPETQGKSSRKTGESYFDELISRRLVQPAFDDNDDQPIGCTVPGVVFDFIDSLSTEANFITQGAELMSGLAPCDRVRRVSIACGDDDEEGDTFIPITYCLLEQKKSLVASSSDVSSIPDEANEDEAIYLHLSRVRTLSFSGDAKKILDLSAFKHVRVLDLEDVQGLELKQLESIGHLSLLRYLGLGGTNVTQLPPEIMALQQLTTLDLRRTRVRRLPQFKDTKLVSLLADELTILPRQMKGMQNLEELSKVILGHEGSFPDEVARLVRDLRCLRMLGARFGNLNCENKTDRQGVKRFLEEAGKSNLQSILLDNYLHPLLDLLAGPWANNLAKFELRIRGCLPQVPWEIASLIGLTHLQINVEAVEGQAVRALGSLPKLVLLKLESNVSSSLTVTKDDGFQCLRVFWYTNSRYGGGVGLKFEGGAVPRLERLRLDFNAWEPMPSNDDGFDFGIRNLTCLEQIHATIDWMNTTLTASEVKAAETRIREQVSGHSNNPVFELNRRRKRLAAVEVEPEELVLEVHSLEEWSKLIDPDKLVVVQFSAEWCPASRKMAPVFSDFAKKFRNAVFLKVDVEADDMDTIAKQFQVKGVPTFVFLKGGNDVDRVIGADKEELEEILEEQVA